ncbi:MAG: DUF4389 domain-containing protein [Patescibacteria group bacterium]|nr:DUF4389 domain-containing protein [Patescibacteria group bacterium]
MRTAITTYPATLEIDYPKQLNRLTTLFRLIWAIPIFAVLAILTGSGGGDYKNEAGKHMASNGGGIVMGLAVATALMILFRQRYPRWWFDFNLELNRFSARVGAYLLLLTDQYPSTAEEQSVHLNIDYPNVEKDLSSWLPLVKWLLAIPHYIALAFLAVGVLFTTVIAWFAILFTGQYPKSLFDFAVGVGRWSIRVEAYALLLTTDKYPPFSLK